MFFRVSVFRFVLCALSQIELIQVNPIDFLAQTLHMDFCINLWYQYPGKQTAAPKSDLSTFFCHNFFFAIRNSHICSSFFLIIIQLVLIYLAHLYVITTTSTLWTGDQRGAALLHLYYYCLHWASFLTHIIYSAVMRLQLQRYKQQVSNALHSLYTNVCKSS